VLEEACEIAVPFARSKGISIEQNLLLEIMSTGDEAFLRDLLLIFLENAVKYSAPNTCIRVSLGPVDGSAQVQFADQGIGISKEHLPHIFERFYRGLRLAVGGSGGAAAWDSPSLKRLPTPTVARLNVRQNRAEVRHLP